MDSPQLRITAHKQPSPMAALSNPRQERYCKILHKTGNQSKAYRLAGYTASTRNSLDSAASRLSRSAKVKERIAEMENAAAKRHNVTVDSLVQELDEAKALAAALEQPSAMVAAINAKAKITGNIIERAERGQPGDFAGLGTAAEVLAAVRRELGNEAADAIEALATDYAPLDPTAPGSDAMN